MPRSKLTLAQARKAALIVKAKRKGKPHPISKSAWRKYLGKIR